MSNSNPVRILIVDDEAPFRRLVNNLLIKKGYETRQASQAREAREIIGRESIDLVLCDIKMPGESGLDLVRWIRETHPALGTIMVSGLDDPLEAQSALDQGVYGYVVKPFEGNQLLITIRNALRRRELESLERSYREKLEQQVREKTRELEMMVQFLKEGEAQYRNLAEGSIQGILLHRELKPLFVNRAFAELHGYSLYDLLRLESIVSLIDPRDRARLLSYREARLRGERAPSHYEYRGLRKDGVAIWLESRVIVTPFEGAPAIQLTVADITERKNAEATLRRSYREMEAVVSGISSILIGLSDSRRIFLWNHQAGEILGLPGSAATGLGIADLPLAWNRERIQSGIDACRTNRQTIRVDALPFIRPDGSQGILGLTLNPIVYEEDRDPGVLIMGADVTHKRVLEMQQSQARKLEAIGQLAAGIAHEINTPIQYVGDNTRFLQGAFGDLFGLLRLYEAWNQQPLPTPEQDLPARIEAERRRIDLPYLEEEIPQAIAQTLEGVDRVRRIVLSMKEFSHPGTNSQTPVDINRALENTVIVARNEWKYVADLSTDLDPALPPVPCIPGEINQVFLNILVNAAQAIGESLPPGGGRKGLIRIETRAVNGDVEIRISDNGSGIPKELLNRIFDPFFTTKEPGKGTGQGLAIAHNAVVKKHGGKIQIESEVGKGSCFIIRLPIRPREEETV